MQTAYDPKFLVEGLKQDGVELTEDAVKKIIVRFMDWLDLSAQLSTTPFDDMLRVAYPTVKEWALAKADLIDGKVG